MKAGKPGARRICRCEARIAPAILEGYACGNPECWRTAEVEASFSAFVETLVAKRGDAPSPPRKTPPTD
ncbi:protein of unknown function [Beijerinckiaceae bacterium RH AL1]|nr:hypothetical protein [Beijerinckiaceae bacterium]VVB45214.1 protein of unknown function [Beijerinckiaceae bacterium RH CH11]VVB45292.1 protein of unknown function [Beijerinckiaceae bacterium RH AL8]VVC54753.1 protein of unknown function [Beijerinckiaceae bacterium RH AL1]